MIGYDYDAFVEEDVKLRRDYLVGYKLRRAFNIQGLSLGEFTSLIVIPNTN